MLLRSAEVKPLFYRFVQPRVGLFFFFFSLPSAHFRAGSFELGPGVQLLQDETAELVLHSKKISDESEENRTYSIFLYKN